MPESNISDKLQKLGETCQEYRDVILDQFKDLEVEVKDWNFAFGKNEKEYTVEVNLKLGFHSKKN